MDVAVITSGTTQEMKMANKKPTEIASILIPKSPRVRTSSQAKRVALQKGFVVTHGCTEGPQFFRFPQSDQLMTDFKTAKRKANGVKIVKGDFV